MSLKGIEQNQHSTVTSVTGESQNTFDLIHKNILFKPY